jgi:hypothetical protein
MIKILNISSINKKTNYSKDLSEIFTKTSCKKQSLSVNEIITEIVYVPNKKIPKEIVAESIENLDIIKVHELLSEKFGSIIHRNEIINNKLSKLKLQIINNEYTQVEQNVFNNNINELNRILSTFTTKKWQKYISDVYKILESYINIVSDKNTVIIGQTFHNDKHTNILSLLINKYITIAEEFINIEVNRTEKNNNFICSCGRNISLSKINDNLLICECGRELENIVCQSISRPIKFSNKIKGLESYIKKIEIMSGVCSEKIPLKLYNDLDELAISNGLLTGHDYRQMPLNNRGKKNGTSVQILKELLSKTKNNDYYNLMSIIGKNYYGWKLMDLILYKQQLIDIYSITQIIYDEIKTRKSNLNVDIRLYAAEKILGLDADIDDFKGISTLDSLIYHNDMLKIIHTRLDYPIVNIC